MAPTDKPELDPTALSGVKLFPSSQQLKRLWRNGDVHELGRPLLRTKLPLAMVCGVAAGSLGWFAVSIGLNDIVSWGVLTIAVLIALTGLGELWQAIRFSSSRLTLERESYRPGESLRGTLHGPRKLTACETIEFTLQYLEQTTVYPEPGLGARRDIPKTTTIELQTTAFQIKAGNSPGGSIVLPLPIEILIPGGPDDTTNLTAEQKKLWRLTVCATAPGLDYHSEFLLPILDEA